MNVKLDESIFDKKKLDLLKRDYINSNVDKVNIMPRYLFHSKNASKELQKEFNDIINVTYEDVLGALYELKKAFKDDKNIFTYVITK